MRDDARNPTRLARGRCHDPLVRPSPRRRPAGTAGRGPARVLRRRDELARLGAADAGGTARAGRPRRLLDLHLHQLAAHRAVSAARGPRSTRTPGSRSSASTRQSSASSTTSTTSSPQARALGVEYPVAVDSDYGVWRAFDNHFWPAIYLADAEGRIRYHHFGEGEYAMTEMVIQQLLVDAGATDLDRDLVDGRAPGPRGRRGLADAAVARDVRRLRPGDRLRVGRRRPFDQPHVYAAPGRSRSTPGPYGDLDRRRGTPAMLERARRAHRLPVPCPRRQPRRWARRPGARPIPFRVSLDGRPATDALGTDVAADGSGIVDDQRTYQLIRQPGAIAERRFEIEFLERRRRGVLLHVRLSRAAQRRAEACTTSDRVTDTAPCVPDADRRAVRGGPVRVRARVPIGSGRGASPRRSSASPPGSSSGLAATEITAGDLASEELRLVGEIALVLCLFTDASRIDIRSIRGTASLPSRLLLVGLPLTIALGVAFALVLLPASGSPRRSSSRCCSRPPMRASARPS